MAKSPLVRLEEDSLTVRAVLDSMGEGLITINADGIITAVNPYALKALGYEEEELLGQWFSRVVIATDQHRVPLAALYRPVVRALTSGEIISEQSYYLRKDGSLMPVYLSVSPIIIDGLPVGAIELFRDTTKDNQLDFAKDEFVSLASHQLRTPASGVKAILSMMLDEDFGPLTTAQRRLLVKAADGNNRQLQIIEDILNIAQIDSGRMELSLINEDIVGLARQTIDELQNDFTRRKQTVELQADKAVDCLIDPGKMRMVLDNIISNASKYTPEGGRVTVSITNDRRQVYLQVQDTGVGIEQSDIPNIFHKFTRIDNELSTLVGGSGLGLYLCQNIVQLHHGTIEVASQPGQGTMFRIALPRQKGETHD